METLRRPPVSGEYDPIDSGSGSGLRTSRDLPIGFLGPKVLHYRNCNIIQNRLRGGIIFHPVPILKPSEGGHNGKEKD